MSDIFYRVKCTRGAESWYAYNGVALPKDRAESLVKSCKDIHGIAAELVEFKHCGGRYCGNDGAACMCDWMRA